MSRMLPNRRKKMTDEGLQGGTPPSANTRSKSEAGRSARRPASRKVTLGNPRGTVSATPSSSKCSSTSAPDFSEFMDARDYCGIAAALPKVDNSTTSTEDDGRLKSERFPFLDEATNSTRRAINYDSDQDGIEETLPRDEEFSYIRSLISPPLQDITTEDDHDLSAIKEQAPDDRYNFLATEETAPRDECQYRSIFEPSLNESASDYIMHRDAFLQRTHKDLLLGTLGMLNVNEEFSVSDIIDYTENIIASHGVTEVIFDTHGQDILIEAHGVRNDCFSVSEDEFKSDEVVVFNGCVSPYIDVPRKREVIPMKVHMSGHGDNIESCNLCREPGVLDEFETRHGAQLIRHQIHNGILPESPDTGEFYEDLFSIDLTLNGGTNRSYNFLPTASDLTEAVGYIIRDDTSRKRRLGFLQVLSLCFGDVRSSSLRKLLVKYFIMKNCVYGLKGTSIRNVNYCG